MAYGPVNVPGGVFPEELELIETKVQAVSDKIGATGNTGGSDSAGTVMGKLNKLLSDLATHMGRWTATRAGHIDTIKNNTDAIKKQLTDGAAKAGTVKSIQRGTVLLLDDNGHSIAEKTVAISAINPAKCMVLLDGATATVFSPVTNSRFLGSMAYLKEITGTSITIGRSGCMDGTSMNGSPSADRNGWIVSYQIVEFY